MRPLYLLLAAAALAFAQADADTISITVTGSTPLPQPDDVSVSITVNAAVGTTLEKVLEGLSGLPLSERNLLNFGDRFPFTACIPTPAGCTPTTTWSFGFTTPMATLNETLASLARIAAAQPSTVAISYSINSAVSTPPLDCVYPTLISQARRHAVNVAAAAGLQVGAIVAMSDGGGAAQPNSQGVAIAIFDPLTSVSIPRSFGSFLLGPPGLANAICTAVVEFKLLR